MLEVPFIKQLRLEVPVNVNFNNQTNTYSAIKLSEELDLPGHQKESSNQF
jgi:hypothetical protein